MLRDAMRQWRGSAASQDRETLANALWMKWGLIWVGWAICILMVGVLPFSNFVGHSHWEYIHWVPTTEQLRSPLVVLDLTLDAFANILLFVPFGFFYAARLPSKRASCTALIGMAFLLSAGIELYQVYCHNRSTSLLDLIDNVGGAYLGFRLGMRVFHAGTSVQSSQPAAIPGG